MSTNVPTISVTPHTHHSSSSSSESDSDSSNSHGNDMDYSRSWGQSTDVEDFDSQTDAVKPQPSRSMANHLNITNQFQHDVTDVEDYDDSDSDCEVESANKNRSYPELNLSLQEFLQCDIESHQSESNGVKERVEHRPGNFLQAQNLNTVNDYLTDCEDYNTDSELENECSKSVCVDLNEVFVEQGRVNIADATATSKSNDNSEDDYGDVSVASNISDLASAIGDSNRHIIHGLSEDELLELSGYEEVCQIALSDSDSSGFENTSGDELLNNFSLPQIDVKFMTPISSGNRPSLRTSSSTAANCICNTMFLEIEEKRDEVLTDVEGLDDEEDSFDEDEKPIPQAVILDPGDNSDCLTDCEDVLCDSEIDSSQRGTYVSVDMNALPQPQREVVLLQEDRYGDTIASVMPMDDGFQFGMNFKVKEECFTDSEEYSCEDDGNDSSVAEAPLPSQNSLIESDITVSNELMKNHVSKRLEIQSNTESVTDVEELYVDGTNSRRKKAKTRSVPKAKPKHLYPPRAPEDGNTDVEDIDIDLSDSALPQDTLGIEKSNLNVDKVTDVEDLSADDLSSVSEADIPQIDWHQCNLKDYDAISTNVVVALETCASESCLKHKKTPTSTVLRRSAPQPHQQQQTDVEELQLLSDTEDFTQREPATACLCHELNEMLNASCTTVHEKCQSSFNVDDEKLHIKGMPREALTDIEYVESDESAARGSK